VAAIALIDKTDYTAVSPDGFRAKKIKKTENGETFEDLEELTLTLATINQPSFVRAAEAITEQAKAVGIKIQVETVEPSLFYEEIIKPRAYQLLLTATQYGRDADPYPFWHSSQTKDPGLNLSLYTNSKVDGLLEKARVTNNTEERAAAYQEFQKLIIADLPAIFLYQPTYTYAVSSKIKNISLQKIQKPADRFQNITDWYIKTKNVIE
jgi:peptide/nickel transport system substrate-binding protein